MKLLVFSGLWLLCAVLSACIAASKGREWQGRLIGGLLIGPFGLLIGLLPARYKKPVRLAPVHRVCPGRGRDVAGRILCPAYRLLGQRRSLFSRDRSDGRDCISSRRGRHRTQARRPQSPHSPTESQQPPAAVETHGNISAVPAGDPRPSSSSLSGKELPANTNQASDNEDDKQNFDMTY